MSLARRVTALLLMFAWCFANGHLWVEHAGEETVHHEAEMVAVEHHHHDEDDHQHDEDVPSGDAPALPEEHHHHEMSVVTRDSGAATLKAPLVAVLFVTLLLSEVAEGETSPSPAITGSPPDERRSGYLFVVQTAHPVRGPSLVA
jgi:hypothetical protein